MSKASEYADIVRAANARAPRSLESREGNNMAHVDRSGNISLWGGVFSPSDALRLRDWITENFEDKSAVAPGVGSTEQDYLDDTRPTRSDLDRVEIEMANRLVRRKL